MVQKHYVRAISFQPPFSERVLELLSRAWVLVVVSHTPFEVLPLPIIFHIVAV